MSLRTLFQQERLQYQPGDPDYSRTETPRRINWGFLASGASERSIVTGKRRRAFLDRLTPSTRLRFVRDYASVTDPNAIVLYADCGKLKGIDVGCVPHSLTADFARFIDAGQRVDAIVHRVARGVKGPLLLVAATVEKIPMAEQIANFKCPNCDQLIRKTVTDLISSTQISCPACKGLINISIS